MKRDIRKFGQLNVMAEDKSVKVKEFAALKEASEIFKLDSALIEKASVVEVAKEGNNISILRTNKGEFAFTSLFAKQICKFLKFPAAYARRISAGLSLENFNTLLQQTEKNNFRLLYRKDSDSEFLLAIGAIPPSRTMISNDRLIDVFGKHKELKVKEARIADKGMFLNLILPKKKLQGVQGDEFDFGLSVSNSPVSEYNFGVNYYLNRLVCSNGVTAPFRLGGFRASKRFFDQDYIFNRVDNMLSKEADGRMQEVLHYLDKPLSNIEVFLSYTKLENKFSKDVAESVTGINKGDYKLLRKDFIVNHLRNEDYAGNLERVDLFNSLSEFGRDLSDVMKAREAQKLAGDLLGR